jgi:3-hydroxybenzoate 6-monooxygenase
VPARTNRLPIAIAGGGIGGLACALALVQRGFSVIVCEQAPQFGQVGVGLQVAPNALSVLDALGVGQQVKQDALLIERMLMKDGLSGADICDIPCGEEFVRRFGNPYAVAHRADVHGALLRGCETQGRQIDLRTDSRVEDFSIEDRGVSIRLASGDRISAAALIGADGIRSRIRRKLVNDGEPKTVGAAIYRALVPAAAMPPDQRLPFPTLWVGPGAHLIYYPVRDWSVFNVAATVLMSIDAIVEGDTDVEEASRAFAGWSGVPQDVLRVSQRYQRYLIRCRDPIDNWSNGPVTLLGDAAHPMVQYIAQGAAMALEDAMCLADRVDAADGDFVRAFEDYQGSRIVRSARVQLSSLMLDRIYHAAGVERLVRNSIFEGRTAQDYFERLAWLFTAPHYVRTKH